MKIKIYALKKSRWYELDDNEPMTANLEDGYIRIATELFEIIGRTRMSDYEHRVFSCVMRFTYGWQRKHRHIEMLEFVNYTDMSKSHICHTIKKLMEKGMIAYIGNEKKKRYYIIKDYKTWKTLPKQATLPIQAINVAYPGNESLPIQATPPLHNKDLFNKDIIIPPPNNKDNYKDIKDNNLMSTGSDDVFNYWNSKKELPIIRSMSQKRKRALKERMMDNFFKDNWKQAIDNIPRFKFLMGKNDRKWQADIDWFLRPDSC